MTAYLGILDKKTKKEVIYESNLKLAKIRDMTAMERAEIEKKNTLEDLAKQIKKQEKEKEEQLARIAQLEEENSNLK